MTAKDRVQKYRANLPRQQRHRLEVCLGTALIEQMRQATKAPMSRIVQDALAWYLEERRWVVAEGGRLKVERERLQLLLAQGRSPELQGQVDDYNRQLAAFNARVARISKR